MATFKETFLSERMIFGWLIIVGFETALILLIIVGPKLPPEVSTMVAGGFGALGAAVGIMVQAIWKTDKADKSNAQALASLAAKAPDASATIISEPKP